VRILDDGVTESVRLSHRYITARQLPDKCVSVLDTACARVAIGSHAVPARIEDLRRRIDAFVVERRILGREQASGEDHGDRLAKIEGELATAHAELASLEKRWEQERELATAIQALRLELEGARGGDEPPAPPTGEEAAKLRAELDRKKAELARLQGDAPLVMLDVDGQAIAEVIESWTGIPMGKMMADEIRSVLQLADTLKQRVIGQDHGLETIARRVHTARANLDNPAKPIGVFLLVGPSGVGKTESALALAEALYGGERNLITINMSEYQEAHTVSSLKGSPPGYVGYGEGGVLTEAVRRKPYSVVLLDEVEKAHPDVMELFFQVFDKGMLEDGEGREIDFKNTVIILTSNVGTSEIVALSADPETAPAAEGLMEAVRPELLKVFPAALLGRMVTIPYYPLSPDVLGQIVRLQLERIVRRVRENHGAELVYGDDLVSAVLARCNEAESGGRVVDNILTHSMLPQLSAEVLSRMARAETFARVEITVGDGGEFRVALT
jgi:type VI secretion system protein VasG